MSHSGWLLLLLLLLVALSTTAHGECPCGFIGEPACVTLGYVNDNGNEVAVPDLDVPNGTCSNLLQCDFDAGDKSVTCRCNKGWEGELCDEKIQILLWNLILSNIVVPIIVIAGSLWWARRSTMKTHGARWHVPLHALTEGRAPPLAVLIFRICGFAFCLGFLGEQAQRTGWPQNWFMFRFFTVINFTLIAVVLAHGATLSLLRLKSEGSLRRARPDDEAWATAPALPLRGRVYLVLAQTELASALLVSVVTWALLLPTAYNSGSDAAVEVLTGPTSIAQHAFNAVVMLVEMTISDTPMYLSSVAFTLAWGALYMLFHGLLMAGELAAGEPHQPSYDFLSSANPVFIVFVVMLIGAAGIFHWLALRLVRLLKPEMKRRCEEQLVIFGGGGSKISSVV